MGKEKGKKKHLLLKIIKKKIEYIYTYIKQCNFNVLNLRHCPPY